MEAHRELTCRDGVNAWWRAKVSGRWRENAVGGQMSARERGGIRASIIVQSRVGVKFP